MKFFYLAKTKHTQNHAGSYLHTNRYGTRTTASRFVVHSQKSSYSSRTNLLSTNRVNKDLKLTGKDYCQLSQDNYSRFMPNSPIIGNAVLHFNGKHITAWQFAMPGKKDAPKWVPLKNIEQIQRNGVIGYRAQDSCDTTLYSNRGYHFTNENGEHYEFRPFSIPPPTRSEPFWGSQKLISITDMSIFKAPHVIKGGQKLKIDHKSVLARKKGKRRYPDQRQVMKRSALQSYKKFYQEYQDEIPRELKPIFERAINAKRTHPFLSKFCIEWLHAEAWGLTPTWKNPQNKTNFGSGPNWANSKMLIYERACQHTGEYFPEITTNIKPTFSMLFATDLIATIDYEAQFKFQSRSIRFYEHIEPLRQRYPVFPQASDTAQMTGITLAMLSDRPPTVESIVRNIRKNSATSTHPSIPTPHSTKDETHQSNHDSHTQQETIFADSKKYLPARVSNKGLFTDNHAQTKANSSMEKEPVFNFVAKFH